MSSESTGSDLPQSGAAPNALPLNDLAGGGCCTLRALTVLELAGADARTFLQAQFCNDVTGAEPGRALLNGYCQPKGRLLATPVVIARDASSFWLVVPVDLAESLQKRLTMFVLRSAVTITRRDDLGVTGVIADSEGALPVCAQERWPSGRVPQELLAVSDLVEGDGCAVGWHPFTHQGQERRRWLVVSQAAPARSDERSDDLLDPRWWRLADIRAGIPTIVNATREAFVPQMLNMHLIDALSFTKGCYPGQEIVARMQYLGKLKRHMRLFTQAVPGAAAPDRGAAISAGNDSLDDAEAGRVIDAVETSGGLELLAVVKTSLPPGDFRLGGQPLVVAGLPYTLPAPA